MTQSTGTMHDRDCPDREQLLALVLGKLSDGAAAEIADHSESCTDCESTIASLEDTADSFISDLKRPAAGGQFLAESQFQVALSRAVAVGGEPLVRPSAEASSPLDEPQSLEQLGQYKLLAKLGEGGMGAVYKALHTKLGKTVALKILPFGRTRVGNAAARFEREMKAIGTLEHPNIVQAYDAGEAEGACFLAMEYVEGLTLSELVSRLGPLPIAEACELTRQAAVGLEYAHEHGLVHRDIKPSNLMLAGAVQSKESRVQCGQEGAPIRPSTLDHRQSAPTVKILDLGLALLQDQAGDSSDDLTGTGRMMGTADYMAPEQVTDSHNVDIRADIYSLGCTLYKLLAGHAPFGGPEYEGAFNKVTAHVHDRMPSIRERRSDVTEELAGVIERMMVKEPSERFPTPGDVVEAMAPFTGGCDLSKVLVDAERKPQPAAEGDEPSDGTEPHRSSAVVDTDARHAPPKPAAAPPGRRWRRRAIALGGLAAIVLGVIIYINTNHGRLVIDAKVDDIRIVVERDGRVTIIDPAVESTVKLRPGKYDVRLEEERAGLSLNTRSFTMKRSGEVTVEVRYEPTLAVTPPKKPGFSEDATRWQPGPADNVLPGIVPCPAILPGIDRWQVETVGPRDAVHAVAWSPDGKLIACGTGVGNVRIYEAGTLRLVRVLVGHAGGVTSIAWSPDSQRLASSGLDRTVRLWEADGRRGPDLDHPHDVASVAWSFDGQRLACACMDHTVRLWRSDGRFEMLLKGHRGSANCLAWSPDGQWLASGDYNGPVHLWHSDGTPGPVMEGHAAAVKSVAWTPDGQRLASGSTDSTVRLWQVDGTPGPVLEHRERVYSVACSADGQWLASTNEGGTVRLWQADGTPGSVLKGRHIETYCVAWSPDSQWLASAGADGTVKLWQADGTPGPRLGQRTAAINSVAWSPDARRIALGTQTTGVRLWGTDGIPGAMLGGHTDTITSVAWSPDGRWLASGGRDNMVRLWQADETSGPVLKGHADHVESMAWSPDGRRLASGGRDNTVRLWQSDGTPGAVLKGHTGYVQSVAWSPDGRWLASGSWDHNVRLWQADGTPGRVLEHPHIVSSLAWSPNGEWLASGSHEPNKVRVWQRDGTLRTVLEGDTGQVHSVCWSPNGRRLACGGIKSKVCLWQADGTPEAPIDVPFGTINSVAWSPDSKQLIAGGSASAMQLWDMETGEPDWTVLFVSDSHSFTFSSAGQILHGDPEIAEKELVYVVEKPSGALELLKYSEFHKRVATGRRLSVESFEDTVDANPGDGVVADANGNRTLRASIMEANAKRGADTIVLPSGTFRLTIRGAGENDAATGDLDINDDLSILGAGADATIIDANRLDRVFHIMGGMTVRVSGVTLTGGRANVADSDCDDGGGILNSGSKLAIENSTVSGNAATGGGGIHNGSGWAAVANSTVSENSADGEGGGIWNGSNLTVENSAILGNRAKAGGGGMVTAGPASAATVTNSTLSANSTGGGGGGIYTERAGRLIVNNSTLSGNMAGAEGGGIAIAEGATLTVSNSTLTANRAAGDGGGIHNASGSRVDMIGTILAGNNAAAVGPDGFNEGIVNPQGHNLVGDNSGFDFTAGPGDVVGTLASPIDPKLGPLADNGGPTLTHALLPDSPAIDAGDNGDAPASDQRGAPRIADGDGTPTVDIGAFEHSDRKDPSYDSQSGDQ